MLVNGFGVIGRRVADAVVKQRDMELVGVVKTKPDYKALIALRKGYKVYAADESCLKEFERKGFDASGTLADALENADIVVDATPKKVGAKNKPIYEKKGIPAIFEGGEKANVADVSFVAQCNYDKAYGKKYIRVVSCNTTGLCRILNCLDKNFGVEKAWAVIVRRAADPDDTKGAPLDMLMPNPPAIPSHHGPDVQTVLPHIDIVTMAVMAPVTHMHLHSLIVRLKGGNVKKEDVVEALEEERRILVVSAEDGIISTAQLIDLARDLHRPRNDLYEICVWRESVSVVGSELYMFYGVQQESDVIPENIDAIRASLRLMGAEESMDETDRSLGIVRKL